jgi:hypothetical protein
MTFAGLVGGESVFLDTNIFIMLLGRSRDGCLRGVSHATRVVSLCSVVSRGSPDHAGGAQSWRSAVASTNLDSRSIFLAVCDLPSLEEENAVTKNT